MSNIVSSLVQRRKVGSPTRKAVLLFMANCASDDGSGVWTSKSNIARDLEMGRRTVQKSVDDLAAAGLISEAGQRSCKNGFTVEYRLNLSAIEALESTRAAGAHVQDVHMTRAAGAQQDVQDVHINHTGTTLEPHTTCVRVDFSDFYEAWPNRNAMAAAEDVWLTLSEDERVAAVQNAAAWFKAWRKDRPNAAAINPARYLREKRWTDSAAEKATAADSLNFYAGLINSDKRIPPSLISSKTQAALLSAGLVTPERMKARV